jgi:hypothetical protein
MPWGDQKLNSRGFETKNYVKYNFSFMKSFVEVISMNYKE